MKYITEPEKNVAVINEVDVCVVGGSCTGVFAAVRAAKLGASVAIVEKQNSFGGVATSGFVHIWHSLYDNAKEKKIISGMTEEVLERLRALGVVTDKENLIGIDRQDAYYFNSEELKIELDKLIIENKITPYLHTHFAGIIVDNGEIKAIFVENKSGRGAIVAKIFVDASGDGDLSVSSGLEEYRHEFLQPPSSCCKIMYNEKEANLEKLILQHSEEFGLKKDRGWYAPIPEFENIYMKALTHVFDVDCSNANDLTFSEIEGRRQIRAYMDISRKYYSGKISLVALCSYIGVRQTRQIKGMYQLTDDDVMTGRKFEDGIANCSYPVDIHKQDGTMEIKYLSGNYKKILLDGTTETGRWCDSDKASTYYQIPYRSMVSTKCKNLIVAGRMVDSEISAFSSMRVMVNSNQMGEAAGVAAYVAINSGKPVYDIDISILKSKLKQGGSLIL